MSQPWTELPFAPPPPPPPPTGLECTCGAISTYLRSWERSTYPQITHQRFSAHLLPTYRYLLSAWLPSEDTEVKLAVLKALGPVLNILLPRKDLQNQIYGDIPLLLAQYGKNIEAFYITKERPMRSLPLGGRLEKTVQKTSLATSEIIIASGRGLSQRHLRLPSSCWPGSWCCQHPPSREKGAEWLRCSC
ncbi:hypothetical protein KIL84_021409 [Mauremys mutica]|uniref:MROH2B-like N-terminal HEAT-repeats domain-containing protein n=1 Tax=Mauremys mutica TaxID=74926 RepID=A0A9D3X9K1_9SAUR|nr:hypothetical protein KIL84_021409 [Mauremys mutica]